MEIDDNLLVDVMDRPPMPTPRRQRSTDDDEFCFVDAHSKLPRKHSGNGVDFDYNRHRRTVGDGCGDDRHGNERAHTLPIGERIRFVCFRCCFIIMHGMELLIHLYQRPEETNTSYHTLTPCH